MAAWVSGGYQGLLGGLLQQLLFVGLAVEQPHLHSAVCVARLEREHELGLRALDQDHARGVDAAVEHLEDPVVQVALDLPHRAGLRLARLRRPHLVLGVVRLEAVEVHAEARPGGRPADVAVELAHQALEAALLQGRDEGQREGALVGQQQLVHAREADRRGTGVAGVEGAAAGPVLELLGVLDGEEAFRGHEQVVEVELAERVCDEQRLGVALQAFAELGLEVEADLGERGQP